MSVADVGAVVIGRNEEQNVRVSLSSVRDAGIPLVFVDSASEDASVRIARPIADAVVELTTDRPLSAARARNAGLQELMARWPTLRYVLFLDADCQLDESFLEAAVRTFASRPRHAVVVGHLTEADEARNVFARLCALEWRSGSTEHLPPTQLGGIMLARVEDIRQVGGFNEQIIAGEDTELGVRLGMAGRLITKIDHPMALHNANMNHFGQWWRRAVRGGHAIAQRFDTNGRGPARDCARELKSTVFWGLALPLLILVLLWPSRGWSALLGAGYLILGMRLYNGFRSAGIDQNDALLATRFGLYAKFANAVGVIKFYINRTRGKYKLIEYKQVYRRGRE
jgi:GT2 family glycosyltransferase